MHHPQHDAGIHGTTLPYTSHNETKDWKGSKDEKGSKEGATTKGIAMVDEQRNLRACCKAIVSGATHDLHVALTHARDDTPHPLLLALCIVNDRFDALRLLAESGADLDLAPEDGRFRGCTPLVLACF